MSNVEQEVELKDKQALALDDILRSQEKLDALFKEAKRYAIEIGEQKRRASNLNADIKATAEENFGISAVVFKGFVTAMEGDLTGAIARLTSQVDVLQMLKERLVKANGNADLELDD